MKNLIYILLSFSTIWIPSSKANENFSVEIEALTLVMEKYKEELSENVLTSIENPNYVAFKQDECNATVEVTESVGLQINNVISFDVNVCNKVVNEVISN